LNGFARTTIRRPLALIALAALAPLLAACGGTRAAAGGAAGAPTATAAAAPSASDPSGQPMPRATVPGWHRVFADNFTRTVPLGHFPAEVASTWGNTYPDGSKDTSKQGRYEPTKVVSIANGVMNMHLHTQDGIHMVVAALPTIPGAHGSYGGMLYGRFVLRMRADFVPGYKIAILLWPDSGNWPTDGEIDFPEADLDGPILGFVHHQGGTTPNDQIEFPTTTTLEQWHTATVTWLPTGISFELDGRVIGTAVARIPNTPMHLIIQAETTIGGAPTTNGPAGNIKIDWLTVDTPACNPSMSIAPHAAACATGPLPTAS
jgi:beta-glucanase (GH16 family)